MKSTLANAIQEAPLRSSETDSPDVVRDLRKAETAIKWRGMLGAAIKRARYRCEWSLKEFAAKVDRDERQVARWEDGSERAQWDALFALDDCDVTAAQVGFRQFLILSLAELSSNSFEIEMIVRMKRTV